MCECVCLCLCECVCGLARGVESFNLIWIRLLDLKVAVKVCSHRQRGVGDAMAIVIIHGSNTCSRTAKKYYACVSVTYNVFNWAGSENMQHIFCRCLHFDCMRWWFAPVNRSKMKRCAKWLERNSVYTVTHTHTKQNPHKQDKLWALTDTEPHANKHNHSFGFKDATKKSNKQQEPLCLKVKDID